MLSRHLQRALPALLVCLASLLLLPSVQDVVRDWNGAFSSLSHGPLLFAIVVWLVWRQGGLVAEPDSSVRVVAGLLLLALGTLATVGRLSTLQPLSGLAWPPALLALLTGVYGREGLRRFAVPTLMLYFAMPVWAPLEFGVLWPATVAIAPRIVAAFGIPLRADGEFVHLTSGTFEIEPGCSGANFVLVGLLLSALIAHLWRVPPKRAIAIIAGGGVLAFLANLVRVVFIMVLGHFTQMKHPWVEDHMFLGWWVFAVAFGLSFWWLQRHLGRGIQPDPVPLVPARRPFVGVTLALLVAVGAAPLGATVALEAGRTSLEREVHRVTASVGGTELESLPASSPLTPEFSGADLERRFVIDGAPPMYVYLNAFFEQHRGKELLSDETQLLPAAAVIVVKERSVPLGDAAGSRIGETLVRDKDGAVWLLRDAFYAGSKVVAAEGDAKRALLIAVLRHGPVVAGAVATITRCESEACDAGREASDAFWRRIATALATH